MTQTRTQLLVERGPLRNRCPRYGGPRVRIHLIPPASSSLSRHTPTLTGPPRNRRSRPQAATLRPRSNGSICPIPVIGRWRPDRPGQCKPNTTVWSPGDEVITRCGAPTISNTRALTGGSRLDCAETLDIEAAKSMLDNVSASTLYRYIPAARTANLPDGFREHVEARR